MRITEISEESEKVGGRGGKRKWKTATVIKDKGRVCGVGRDKRQRRKEERISDMKRR